ncbi:MFS transporter [Brachybacterium muris]|uniref:MFS transporter n=1 Tax=Brachybacterium muris TaxID=219301 RepID=UPI00223BCE8A|nr:MFS transporter [Brachybacterium muris]
MLEVGVQDVRFAEGGAGTGPLRLLDRCSSARPSPLGSPNAPLLPVLGGSWRTALAIWALPAGLALVLWLPQLLRSPGRLRSSSAVADAPVDHGRSPLRAILTDPTAIAVTGFMGLQSVSYYTTVTWVPTILQDAGMGATAAGGMIAFSAFPAALAALLAPTLAARMRPTWLPPVLAVLLLGAAYLGLIIAPASGAVAWMTVLGLGLGASISLSLTYIVWRSPTTHLTGHLSTMSQGFGYLIAGLGPLGIGALHGATDSWAVPLIVLCVVLVGQLVAGIVASRPVHICARDTRVDWCVDREASRLGR